MTCHPRRDERLRRVMRSTCRLVLLLCAVWASEAASPPPPSPPSKAPQKADASRPALRRQPGASDLLSGGADSTALSAGEDEDAPELKLADDGPAPAAGKSLLQQLLPLIVVLIVRIGLTFLRGYYRSKGGSDGDGGGSPLDAVNAALLKSAIGGVLSTVGQGWSAVASFARSPQAAPVMMGLLIAATRLVRMMEGKNDAAAAAAENEPEVEAEVEVATEGEGDEAEVVVEEVEPESDGEDADDDE